MKGALTLEGLEFLCRHGCLPQEKENDNLFVVNFSGTYDMTAAASSDTLSDAIDCALIYRIVAREMGIPANLLEHLCARIYDAIAGAFPELESFSVEVCKRNPPVDGSVGWSKVKMSR
ncbi:MAG: dihydroneopterin aldolase [Bacteroidales bacterium]|nr:dihydroneopterin aldolase [Bacteroidales bacterium]